MRVIRGELIIADRVRFRISTKEWRALFKTKRSVGEAVIGMLEVVGLGAEGNWMHLRSVPVDEEDKERSVTVVLRKGK